MNGENERSKARRVDGNPRAMMRVLGYQVLGAGDSCRGGSGLLKQGEGKAAGSIKNCTYHNEKEGDDRKSLWIPQTR